eukprot:UN30794
MQPQLRQPQPHQQGQQPQQQHQIRQPHNPQNQFNIPQNQNINNRNVQNPPVSNTNNTFASPKSQSRSQHSTPQRNNQTMQQPNNRLGETSHVRGFPTEPQRRLEGQRSTPGGPTPAKLKNRGGFTNNQSQSSSSDRFIKRKPIQPYKVRGNRRAKKGLRRPMNMGNRDPTTSTSPDIQKISPHKNMNPQRGASRKTRARGKETNSNWQRKRKRFCQC